MKTCNTCGHQNSANAKKCVCGNVLELNIEQWIKQWILSYIPLVGIIIALLSLIFGAIYQNYTLIGFGVIMGVIALWCSFVILLK